MPPLGLEKLAGLGTDLYEKTAPDKILTNGNPMKFRKQKDKVVLTIALPNLDKKELDIGRKENELIIAAGEAVRVLQLPDHLWGFEVEKADYRDERLVITLGKPKSS